LKLKPTGLLARNKMTENHVQQALASLFERQRIVFWYDNKQKFRDAFESLEMEGIEKRAGLHQQLAVGYATGQCRVQHRPVGDLAQ
jgi:hypothetical protein